MLLFGVAFSFGRLAQYLNLTNPNYFSISAYSVNYFAMYTDSVFYVLFYFTYKFFLSPSNYLFIYIHMNF